MNSLMMDEHTGSPEPTPAPVPPTEVVEEPRGEPENEKKEELIITELDRLKAENLSLRVQTLMFTREKFINQANQKVVEYDHQIMEVRTLISALQKELTERYGIDFAQYAIEPGTGRVIPAPQS